MCECIYRMHVCVNVCTCVCARGGVVCPSVRRARIEACASRHAWMPGYARAQTHIIGGPIGVCLQPYPRVCAYGWM